MTSLIIYFIFSRMDSNIVGRRSERKMANTRPYKEEQSPIISLTHRKCISVKLQQTSVDTFFCYKINIMFDFIGSKNFGKK